MNGWSAKKPEPDPVAGLELEEAKRETVEKAPTTVPDTRGPHQLSRAVASQIIPNPSFLTDWKTREDWAMDQMTKVEALIKAVEGQSATGTLGQVMKDQVLIELRKEKEQLGEMFAQYQMRVKDFRTGISEMDKILRVGDKVAGQNGK